MKRITRLLGVALAVVTSSALAKVETTNDRFNPGARVAMSSGKYPYEVRFWVVLNVNPAKPLSEQTAKITFKALGRTFNSCFATHWLADNQPLQTPEAEHRPVTIRGAIQVQADMIEQTVPWSTIATLADAQTVEFQICRAEFKLTPEDSDQLKEFVRQVKTATSTP